MYKRLNECIANNKDYFYKLLWCITLSFIIAAITFNFSSCKQLFEGENDKESASIALQLPSTKRSLGDTAQNYAEITKHYEVSFIRSGISDITVKGLPGETVTSGEILEGSYDVEVYAYSYEDKKIGYGKKTDVRVIDGETTLITIGISEIKEPTNDDEENLIGDKPHPTAIGDIVFSDGSATAYTAGMTLTDEQKSAAIAVIFYAGGDSKLGERVLGVGIKSVTGENSTGYAWATYDNTNTFPSIKSYYIFENDDAFASATNTYHISGTKHALTDDFDGSDNWSVIASTGGIIADYPAFEWAYKYGQNHSLSGTSYESGWYLPCFVELLVMCKNKASVNASLQVANDISFPNSGIYWTSNSYNDSATTAADFYWGDIGDFSTANYRTAPLKICAIHKF